MATALFDTDFDRAEAMLIGPVSALRHVIAHCIAEERERCAVIADTEAAEYLRQIDEHNKSLNTYRAASDIPDYIRERGIHIHAKYSASQNLAGLLRAILQRHGAVTQDKRGNEK